MLAVDMSPNLTTRTYVSPDFSECKAMVQGGNRLCLGEKMTPRKAFERRLKKSTAVALAAI